MFNLLCVSLYCDYSTRGNGTSQKYHVCGTKSGASHFRTGLAVEVVVQCSSYLNVPKYIMFLKACEAATQSLPHCDCLRQECK